MPYITREDGERFVIPSYRDVLAVKQKNALKKEIMLLSQSYGEYITLQRKGPNQWEVAFSPDTGYLLGETIWHQFKRPVDMIYCEAIANTTEAILVIVKNSSVYLDGKFPIESIPEELIIFLTQQNNFEIYVYGDVPISETPEEGKFSFEPGSVKSFTHLDDPIFPKLPLLRMYQLQPVDVVLRAQGIGVFPLKQLALGILAIGLVWYVWSYLHSETAEIPQVIAKPSPYDTYYATLMSPAPTDVLKAFQSTLSDFQTIPGWRPISVTYKSSNVSALMQSAGSPVEILIEWAKNNNTNILIQSDGIYLSKDLQLTPRPRPTEIYSTNEVIAKIIDDLATVYPGNHLKLGATTKSEMYSTVRITISFDRITPIVLSLISDKLKDMPLVLQDIQITLQNGLLTGSMNLDVLGT